MLQHYTFANGKCFKGFQGKVAEVVVKVLADLFNFSITFIGERIAKILQNHLLAISCYII